MLVRIFIVVMLSTSFAHAYLGIVQTNNKEELKSFVDRCLYSNSVRKCIRICKTRAKSKASKKYCKSLRKQSRKWKKEHKKN